jgi:hypothetical protein
MSALPQATYPINELYLFTVYQSREDYAMAQGKDAPPFDATRPPKYWFDPAADSSPVRTIVYQNVLAYAENGGLLLDADGKPQVEATVMLKKDAANVNIPPSGPAVPGATVPPVPVPLRALDAAEELFLGFGGVVAVRNKTFVTATQDGFTVQDRKLIQAIATKLGVTV